MSIEQFGFPKRIDNMRTINTMKVNYARKALREFAEMDNNNVNEDVKQSIGNFISSVIELLDGEKDELIVQIRKCLNGCSNGENVGQEVKDLRSQLDKRFPETVENHRAKSKTPSRGGSSIGGRQIKYKM